MSNSGVIDLVVGVFFVFLIFSLVTSGVNEVITRALAWRSRHLWQALRQLLDAEEKVSDARPMVTAADASLTGRLYAHPLIRQLEGRLPTDRSRLSNIPATDFSRALIDILVPNSAGQTSIDEVRSSVRALDEDSPIKAPLLSILNEVGDQVAQLRESISQWFDGRMESLSRTYKRHAKWMLLVIGVVVAPSFNVDAIEVSQRLYRDEALRSAVVQQANALVSKCEENKDVATCARTEVKKLDPALGLPIGWPDPNGIDALQVGGWLLTGIALGQGAPFWFDLLRRAGRLRGG